MPVLIELAALCMTIALVPVLRAQSGQTGRVVEAPAFMLRERIAWQQSAFALGFLCAAPLRTTDPGLKPKTSVFLFPSPEGEGFHHCRAPDKNRRSSLRDSQRFST